MENQICDFCKEEIKFFEIDHLECEFDFDNKIRFVESQASDKFHLLDKEFLVLRTANDNYLVKCIDKYMFVDQDFNKLRDSDYNEFLYLLERCKVANFEKEEKKIYKTSPLRKMRRRKSEVNN